MSRTDTLITIKKAEEEARAIAEKALSDSRNAVASSRRDAVSRIQDAEAQLRREHDDAVAKEMKALGAQSESQLSLGRSRADDLEKAAAARIEKVKEFLKKEFERTIDATS